MLVPSADAQYRIQKARQAQESHDDETEAAIAEMIMNTGEEKTQEKESDPSLDAIEKMLQRAVKYEESGGGNSAMQKAALWYGKAADAGSPEALTKLKQMPLTATMAWWAPRAQRGDREASFHLAKAYESGSHVKKNLAKAADYYGQAALKGHEASLEAMRTLPLVYTERWWQTRAHEGDSSSLLMMAESYEQGTGVLKDLDAAARLYGRAAQSGDKLALEKMRSLPTRHVLTWWERQALAGDVEAALFVATRYEQGNGVVANPVAALRFYEMAALRGNAEAKEALGKMPFAQSVPYWQSRAEAGELEACLYLAYGYAQGSEGVFMIPRGFVFALRAALLGDALMLQIFAAVGLLFLLLLLIPRTRGGAFFIGLGAFIWLMMVSFI